MDQLSIKERILSSISYAQKELGYTLVREGFGDSISKCACALSCVLLADNPGNILDTGRILYSSAKILGVDPRQCLLWMVLMVKTITRNMMKPGNWVSGFVRKPIRRHMMNMSENWI